MTHKDEPVPLDPQPATHLGQILTFCAVNPQAAASGFT